MGFSFIVYDLVFLVLFTVGALVFVKTRTHNVEKQGWLYLYKTQWGIKFIDKFAKRFEKILRPTQYLIVTLGYILMATITWLIAQTTYVYLKEPGLAEAIKAPPIVPLIPYFPELFGLDSFFPPFYFTYFIIAIAIVAVVHEFAHGIFARLNKIKIHSTGFAFLGPILGAFVEQDEKQMTKAKRFPQLAILGAGVFANTLIAVIFFFLLMGFFTTAFIPAGVQFDNYANSVINLSDSDFGEISLDSEFLEINYKNSTFFAYSLSAQATLDNNLELIRVFDSAPAFNSRLPNTITKINGFPVTSHQDLVSEITVNSPGDIIEITTLSPQGIYKTQGVELADRNGQAYLGVGFNPIKRTAFTKLLSTIIIGPEDPNLHYESKLGDFGIFTKDLIWWVLMINILVALFNMLPVGILDGGRFFMLTIWGITGNKKLAEKVFGLMTWLILLVVVLLMVKWVFIFF
jgi:membrane-associated protease RseP (regulator of RpoE activity)